MEIIPVIDLMGGIAVHAKQGRRDSYRPLQSPCCASPDPFDVLAGYLSLNSFRTFYIADLDALMGKGSQEGVIHRLQDRYPELDFWVDEGCPMENRHWTPIIGSESLRVSDWERLKGRGGDWILSLDFFDDRLRGPGEILREPQAWPQRVIVMSLNHVGSFAGPDVARLEGMRHLAPDRGIIAAGGVRHVGDLEKLESLGIAAVLTASALHEGRLKPWFDSMLGLRISRKKRG
ncbi:MAG: HisA/HisF-related TIM barrel protein [Methylococcaceae bacterium]|nr:HisA/HisF-related TIM barrel protein [Methylococcaceae bacterium]